MHIYIDFISQMIDIENIKGIRIEDFNYELPDDRIPRHPLKDRDHCRLLVNNGINTEHHFFNELPNLIPPGALLVCNETRVINARMQFEKETGAKIEVFLLEPIAPHDYVLMFQARGVCVWGALVGNLKRWKDNPLVKDIQVDGRTIQLRAFRQSQLPGGAWEVRFEWDDPEVTFASVVDAAGYIPIPPYLKRNSEESDSDDYQTVYARVKGSVAAPTAGLHFTPELFDRLRAEGVDVAPVSLHVGAGTFQPVKSETIGEHPMHTEVFTVEVESLRKIIDALRSGRNITAVGTTSVRTLESLPYIGAQLRRGDESLSVGQWEAYDSDLQPEVAHTELQVILDYMESRGLKAITASTSIMIAPGFNWKVVNTMITNFHQPESTLLLLVSSFLERGRKGKTPLWRDIYNEALDQQYRFLSYGDACLFIR